MEINLASYGTIVTNLDLSIPVTSIGGAFYFDAVTSLSKI